MATVYTKVQGSKSVSILSLGTLANNTYIATASQDLGANIPLDKTISVECTPSSSTSQNKQLVVFAKLSLDNTDFGSGPESGTTATNELDLHYIGTLPCNDNSLHRKMFSLAGLPTARYIKLIFKNDMGVSLTSGAVYWADITGSGV